jgi:hypothetical protein
MIVKDEHGNTAAHLAMATLERPETSATPAELSALLDGGAECPKCGSDLISSFGLMGGGLRPDGALR